MERYGNANDITIVSQSCEKRERQLYASKYASLTFENRQQTFVFRKHELLMPFFIKPFYLKNAYRYTYFGWCLDAF